MSDVALAYEIWKANRGDIKQIIEQIGGIDGILRTAPAVFRIMKTVAAHNDDPRASEDLAHGVLFYSEETKNRVAHFQRAHGLNPDGIIGDKTWSAIEQLIGKTE